ncbi:hypothetical protein GMORB2_5667 [Geosmithia morbida]|uniref:Pre-mRNA splicing factor CLF1 n=1 Tax=Geosmithia morbida TaxID=1094350 RepID=A0A9P4YVN7_9HYPO|nr:uncharacterized protein GMORB2_5667 [Geosmithia morbida]KAF4123951.1 hypothetical protein GMORB2_5667 [Geosmithia morbida]
MPQQPKPPISIDNSCAAIRDGTLYVYSSDGFQSLSMEEGAEWKKLAMGEPVEGAACVGTTPSDSDDAGFWVVGGTGGTTGLQKFTYSTGKWETVTPQGSMIENRRFHAVSYIQSDDLILMFAGSTSGDEVPTAETFTIHTSEPYQVDSYPSAAPNSVRPILLRMSDAETIMVGGSASNTAVYVFKTAGGWTNTGATLAEPIAKDTTQIQGALVKGRDSSENLYLFDMTVSPNDVKRFVLQDGSGKPVSSSPALTKRQSTESDWPDYNSTMASTVTRENYGIAQGSDGTVVFTGGSTEEPLSMFDAYDNSWLDASDSSHDGLPSNTILGIVLGSIFGLLAVLVLVLLILRRRRNKDRQAAAAAAAAAAGGSKYDREGGGEKDFEAFRNPPAGNIRGHRPTGSSDSYSSMAILMGRANQQNSGAPRKVANEGPAASRYKDMKSLISKPIPQEDPNDTRDYEKGPYVDTSVAAVPPQQRSGAAVSGDGTRRSSGWNKYWSSGSAKMLIGISGGGAKRGTVATDTDRSSKYSLTVDTNMTNNANTSNLNPRVTQDSATVPPLNFEGLTAMSRVNSGSPVVTGHQDLPFGEGVAGKIERSNSVASMGAYSSGIPESVTDVWVPSYAGEQSKVWGTERAPSSVYEYGGTSNASSFNPPGGRRPVPSGVSTQPQLVQASKSSDMSWLNLGDQPQR